MSGDDAGSVSVGAEGESTALRCVVGAELDPELDIVRRRTLHATWWIVAAAAALTVALAMSMTLLALIPVAFVLGWLNLAGL